MTSPDPFTLTEAELLAVIAAAPATEIPATCNFPVSGVVKLANDVVCPDTHGLVVVSDNTIIDFNGHKIVCRGAGYLGSCQGGGAEPEPDNGVDNSGGFRNVHILDTKKKSGDETAAEVVNLDGFDNGVLIQNTVNQKVEHLVITGPEDPAARPRSHGIQVRNVECPGGIHIGTGEKSGNMIDHQTVGIGFYNVDCSNIVHNVVHDNGSRPSICHGILVFNSAHNNIRGNELFENGEGLFGDGGLTLDGPETIRNQVEANNSSLNEADGISTRNGANQNHLKNNTMFFNTGFGNFDAATKPTPPAPLNKWELNNRCGTQTTPEPPPGVCGDTPPST